MLRSSQSESSDSDNEICSKTDNRRHKIKKKCKDRERSISRKKSKDKYKSMHKMKKGDKKRSRSSSDDECLKLKKKKKKDKSDYKRKEKKHSKKKKSDREREIDTLNLEIADKSKLKTQKVLSEETLTDSTSIGIIGPMLPAGLINSMNEKLEEAGPMVSPNHEIQVSNEYEANTITIGPMLPDHLRKEQNENSTRTIGPSLPSNINKHVSSDMSEELNKSSDCIIGPTLPLHVKENITSYDQEATGSSNPLANPAPNKEYSGTEESEEEVYGPVPIGIKLSKAHIELEERALQMQIDKLGPKMDDEPTREEWMTELPAVKAAHFGLGPRQFRTKAGPDLSNRSSWTDTPQDKAKKRLKKQEEKVDYKKEAELLAIRNRDEDQESIAKQSKRTKHSLVEMHSQKMKEKKEESGAKERRPFSRDVDLQVNRFDEAQKKAVLKKAQLLDTRFSSGESKYL